MTRQPEFDEYTRQEAIAAVLDDKRTCSGCGLTDQFVRVKGDDREVTWGDGRVLYVEAHRCLGCMAIDLITRDFNRRTENKKPTPGVYAPGDGIRRRVHLSKPAPEEVS